tara:strand:- start:70 stop:1020 length:951 start_codon:yes stop_codon:yes gene_type:complete
MALQFNSQKQWNLYVSELTPGKDNGNITIKGELDISNNNIKINGNVVVPNLGTAGQVLTVNSEENAAEWKESNPHLYFYAVPASGEDHDSNGSAHGELEYPIPKLFNGNYTGEPIKHWRKIIDTSEGKNYSRVQFINSDPFVDGGLDGALYFDETHPSFSELNDNGYKYRHGYFFYCVKQGIYEINWTGLIHPFQGNEEDDHTFSFPYKFATLWLLRDNHELAPISRLSTNGSWWQGLPGQSGSDIWFSSQMNVIHELEVGDRLLITIWIPTGFKTANNDPYELDGIESMAHQSVSVKFLHEPSNSNEGEQLEEEP